MKPYVILFLLLACIDQAIIAQDSTLLKIRTFRILTGQSDTMHTKGWLANITDSSILVSNEAVHFGSTATAAMGVKEIVFNHIDFVTLNRKNGAARGFATGLACGFALGAIIGLASGDDKSGFIRFSAGEKALVGGLLLGAVSGLAGTVIGAVARKTFIIKRRKEKFDEMRIRVLDKAYRNN